jgi:pyruvate/2-oxoglutarate dehydrogenase complex dihydrolipoamide dehydrogenase (E3) component
VVGRLACRWRGHWPDAGRPVVLFEAMHLGGSCVNFGCIPSKAIIASARLAADARRGASLGILIPEVRVDFLTVMERARHLVAEAVEELDNSFAKADNPRLIRACARLAGRQDGQFLIQVGDTGATALCEQGSEVVQLFVELMDSGATAATMRDAVHIHPTLGEAAKNAVIDAVGSGAARIAGST